MAAYIPERGDLVHLQFDPAAGHEMKGPHYGFVVSPKLFNKRGLAVICPVSQGAAPAERSHGTLVSLLGAGTKVVGNIHCHQLKSLDWQSRQAKLVERAPDFITADAMARIEAILLGE
ncbi:type II toxin-antitoxin system PemK/MazF family toxin [Chitinimonas arctica]|uniref:Type II toxin-antitoxin system PemK/MazF family toxin n=1 Tax=Chitinimonas arctica TaxID=2594795 RepID=A0A516SLR7_9NEIS|nr:type II toxin-antitoxin system PemK/MazF family toxin [Chitinimonas arctica]QDQ29101.1 type II toxin-antitoxin system PemK/MazF family toxin [Chitinimonas arctica]